MNKPTSTAKQRISIDAINGPADQGQERGPDQFSDLDNPLSSTDHGLSNYEQNYPDGTRPVSGPQEQLAVVRKTRDKGNEECTDAL